MKYILTIDEGTTSVRATLFNTITNKFECIEQMTFTQIFPKPAWVEHDAEEIWQKAEICLKKVCKHIDPKEIYGLGITNQRETIVAWDSTTGKALCNAIVWQCRRTSKYCQKLKNSKMGRTIHNKTGLVPDAYFSATKIKWLLENNLQVKKALKEGNLRVGTIESFLVHKLTQGKTFVTDITNASRTMLFNIKTLSWDEDLLKYFAIPKSILPQVVDNDNVVGSTIINGEQVKIAGLIGDQQSSLFGQGCFEVGTCKNTYGTGCFMLLNTGDKIIKSKHGLLSTIAFKINNKLNYALEGSVFNAGSVVDWAIDNLCIAKNPQELTDLALSIDDNDGVYLVPAFTGLGTPYWDMDARAVITGMTRATDKRHIARAVLEGMAYSTHDVLNTMQRDSKSKIKELHVDGGASQNDYLMQFQCNLLQTKLSKFNKESTCLGSVYLTGLATGAYKNLNQIKQKIIAQKNYHPNKTQSDMAGLLKGWKLAVKKCLRNK